MAGDTGLTGPPGLQKGARLLDRGLGIGLTLLSAQLLLAIEGFDSQGVRSNPEDWARIPENRGYAFRLLLLFTGLVAFSIRRRLAAHYREFVSAAAGHARRGPMVIQTVVFALACTLAVPVFATPFPFDGWQWPIVALWWLAMTTALLLSGWVLAPMSFWFSLVRREHRAVLASAGIVAVYAFWIRDGIKRGEQLLWSGDLAQVTLHASVGLLEWFYPNVVLIPDQAIMGLGEFRVHISAECSGIEGAALLLVLVAGYLYAFRDELRFPAALGLLAIAVPMSLLLNVLRIAVLVVIGAELSPQWAIKGFHIYGGLVLLLFECALLRALSQASWFSQPRERHRFTLDFEAALLIPLLVLLAATLLTGFLSIDFDWFYPLRVLAVGVALYVCARALRPLWVRPGLVVPVAAGLTMIPVWLWMIPPDPATNRIYAEALGGVAPAWAAAWLVFRIVGTAITVPLAEELAFRGYLLGLLTRRRPADPLAPLPFDLLAFAGSSVLFGLLHGHWLAGTVAGMAYGAVRYQRGRIVDAVLAHAVTNAGLAVHVLSTGQWSYW